MTVTDEIKYIGVDDRKIDLFEGMYRVPNGISYNSYVILDEKIAVLDTVDAGFSEEWFGNLRQVLGERKPDFLIVQHMEPDHSANILCFLRKYPEARIVASDKAFTMMGNYFGEEFAEYMGNAVRVADGDKLSLGRHKLTFIGAPMVHWPEVIMTYDSESKTLFSADAFGRFGALDKEYTGGEECVGHGRKNVDEEGDREARRYYFGIVGKYGVYVQKVLQKAANLEIQRICPLHGPMLEEKVGYYIDLYDKWSRYQPEREGVVIAYTSMYGNTKQAALLLEKHLRERGCEVVVHDLARCDMSEAVADAFCYSKLVLATTTYNAGIFPFMREFINWLTERNFANRTVGFVENGGWAIVAAKLMRESLERCKGIHFAEPVVRIKSALNEESIEELERLAEVLAKEM